MREKSKNAEAPPHAKQPRVQPMKLALADLVKMLHLFLQARLHLEAAQ